MEEGIQKASFLKRISASFLDLIAIAIITTLFAWLLSLITGYDKWNNKLEDYYAHYENKYSITFRISLEEYEEAGEDYILRYDKAYDELLDDEDAMKAYQVVSTLMVLTITFGLFIAFLIWEFIIPLCLKNGMTVGKKIFGLGVMRTNSVKINHISLFVRSILGKYTIETMIPVYIVIMISLNSIGLVGPIVIGGILLIELILVVKTKNNQFLHCLLSDTCVVDYASQRIYESEEEMIEAKLEKAREEAEKQKYF